MKEENQRGRTEQQPEVKDDNRGPTEITIAEIERFKKI